MSGQKGQHGPHYLKCFKCKRERDMWDNARAGELVRTGRTALVANKIGCGGKREATELLCLRCGHIGLYTHCDVSRTPMATEAQLRGAPCKVAPVALR